MKTRISATDAARGFSELMNRIHYRGDGFIVERGGKVICEILPAGPSAFSGAQLVELLRSLPKPDDEYLSALEEVIATQPGVAGSAWER